MMVNDDDDHDAVAIDVDRILAYESEPEEVCYNQRDLIIYALGLGITDLQFTYEDHESFSAFPLYPVCLAFKGTSFDVVPFPPPSMLDFPDGMPVINPAMILHGEQSIEILQPIPASVTKFNATKKILSFLDKGKGALMETETTLWDPATNTPVIKLVNGAFLRGVTGFTGKSKTSKKTSTTFELSSPPDAIITTKTSATQTQLYRLSGDYNALHIDPEIAESVGFDRPILHGLCTLGIATYDIYKTYCIGFPEAITSISARFAKPFFPGETLETSVWKTSATTFAFQTKAIDRNVVVLSCGKIGLNTTLQSAL